MRKCPKCGYESGDKWFCPECGTAMEENNIVDTAVNVDETKKKKGFFTRPITRKEYWIRMIALFVGGGLLIGVVFAAMLGGASIQTGQYTSMPAYYLGYIAEFILFIIFEIQRLHDANKSAAWILLNLIPGFGFLVAIIVPGCFESKHKNNKWINNEE